MIFIISRQFPWLFRRRGLPSNLLYGKISPDSSDHNYAFYSEFEGLVFRKLAEGKMNYPNDIAAAYMFIQDRHLWNPFQVLYGKKYVILPYDSIDPSLFELGSFISLVDLHEGITRGLSNGIKIARLLKSFSSNSKIGYQYRIELKKSVFQRQGSYCIKYKPERSLFTIVYGEGNRNVSYMDENKLLAEICDQIEKLRNIYKSNLPRFSASKQLEDIRIQCCFSRLCADVIIAISPINQLWYPFEFSKELISDYEQQRSNFPFKSRSSLY